MSYPLRQLEARLQKVVTVISTEIEQDDPKLKGQYVHRDSSGDKFLWGPTPEMHKFHNVESVAEADHIMFLCPACFAKNGGAKGTHQVMVTFAGRNVPEPAGTHDANGQPSRWQNHRRRVA
ncbi:MAG: hypothetical protein GC190_22040 [Alphaproteobacteria bacterium]|nr:hypothetical protein [Alphaproteobacteria bacterium]